MGTLEKPGCVLAGNPEPRRQECALVQQKLDAESARAEPIGPNALCKIDYGQADRESVRRFVPGRAHKKQTQKSFLISGTELQRGSVDAASSAPEGMARLSLPLLAHCLSYRVAETDTRERNDDLV